MAFLHYVKLYRRDLAPGLYWLVLKCNVCDFVDFGFGWVEYMLFKICIFFMIFCIKQLLEFLQRVRHGRIFKCMAP